MKPANLFSNNTQLKKSINFVLQIWLDLDSAKIKAMDDTEMTHVQTKHTLKWLCWIWALVKADNNPAVCATTDSIFAILGSKHIFMPIFL